MPRRISRRRVRRARRSLANRLARRIARALLSEYPDLDDQLVDLVLIGRQVGIVVVVVSQGGDWSMMPTKLRQQLSWRLLHRMDSDALRLVARDLAGLVDMSLFDVPGLLYVSGGQGELMPLRAYALYRNTDKRALAGVWRRQAVPAQPTKDRRSTVRGEDRRQIVQRAVEETAARLTADVHLDQRPLDAVFAAVPAEVEPDSPEDEEVTRRILDRLRQAGDQGVSSDELADAAGVSRATVIRRLGVLRSLGVVQATGRGPQTRWHLTPAGVVTSPSEDN